MEVVGVFDISEVEVVEAEEVEDFDFEVLLLVVPGVLECFLEENN